MRPTKYKKDNPPLFIEKLYAMLNDQQNWNSISWTANNHAFAIIDLNKFTSQVLPLYYKHSNYHSFIRQLNTYCFSKVRSEQLMRGTAHIYQHQYFAKGEVAKLKEIRKKKKQAKVQDLVEVENDETEDNRSKAILTLQDKLNGLKEKQDQLNKLCYEMMSQNKALIDQNNSLAMKIKKETLKKDRIMKQIFRIVSASISQFWSQFEDSDVEDGENALEDIYGMLMKFIDSHSLPSILQALSYIIDMDENPSNIIFKVMNINEANLLNSYTDEEINEFINATDIILTESTKSKKHAEECRSTNQ